jgi:uncharacterized protein YhhL (DUF1145 family)
MKESIIYEEKRPFYSFIIIMIGAEVFLVTLLLFQVFNGPVGDNPAPNWILLLLILIFTVLTLLYWGYKVRITPEFLWVVFPVDRVKIPWGQIISAKKLDKLSPLAGYGVRLVKYKGEWVKAFNMPRSEKIILQIRGRKYRHIIISVKNADDVLNHILQRIDAYGKGGDK